MITPKTKIMWAILHVPSNSWDRGDSNLKFYWAEYEANLACVNEAFKPVKVEIRVKE